MMMKRKMLHKLISVQSWRRKAATIIVLFEIHTCMPHSISNILFLKIYVIVICLFSILISNTNSCNKNPLVITAHGNLEYYSIKIYL